MNTYNFTAYNTVTITADFQVEALSLEAAMVMMASIDPRRFHWEVPDWSSTAIEACIDSVEIDGEDDDICETLALEWMAEANSNGDWRFRSDNCVINGKDNKEAA